MQATSLSLSPTVAGIGLPFFWPRQGAVFLGHGASFPPPRLQSPKILLISANEAERIVRWLPERESKRRVSVSHVHIIAPPHHQPPTPSPTTRPPGAAIDLLADGSAGSAGLGRVGLGWVGLTYIGVGVGALRWVGLGWTGLDRVGSGWLALGRSEWGWIGLGWGRLGLAAGSAASSAAWSAARAAAR